MDRPSRPQLAGGEGGRPARAQAPPALKAPQAGTMSGYGETFKAGSFTGTADLSLPIPLPVARTNQLALQLGYVSGGGNGPWGLGFHIPLGKIARRTDKGIPRYDARDRFELGGAAELVVAYTEVGGTWVRDEREETLDDVVYRVTGYRQDVESSFPRIEQWADAGGDLARVFWKTVDGSNTTSFYGRADLSRVVDPLDPTRIFEWLVDEVVDASGNRTLYEYKRENGANLPDTTWNAGRVNGANRYIDRIRYGNYLDGTEEKFAFSVLFDYGQYDLDPVNLQPVREWAAREDCFSSYRSGFEVRTNRLCSNILVVHDLPELGGERLVTRMRLDYVVPSSDPLIKQSMLHKVTRVGYRFRDGAYVVRALPPVELGYTTWSPETQTFTEMDVGGSAAHGQVGSAKARLVDLFADGLPGILYGDEGEYRYAAPRGNGMFDAPQPLPFLPDAAMSAPLDLTDLDGDGFLDFVVAAPTHGGYYRSDQRGGWRSFEPFEAWTSAYLDPAVETVDLSGNGLGDLFIAGGDTIRYWLSLGTLGFEGEVDLPQRPDFPSSGSGSETTLVGFGQMFGDGLQHRVRISDGSVTVWPNLGYGRFGDPVVMANAPRFGEGITSERVQLVDVSSSGCADLVIAHADHLEIHLNLLGNAFGDAIRIPVPGGIGPLNSVQFTDLLGTGTAAVVIGTPRGHAQFLDFAGGRPPCMLETADNHTGLLTTVTYRSSTSYAMADAREGQPWVTKLPFPVQVVDTVRTLDRVSAVESVRVFEYRDGYFDPVDREFRGFGFIQTQNSETIAPGVWHFPSATPATGPPPEIQPSLIRSWNLTGAYVEGVALEAQFSREYWNGDPEQIRLPESRPDRAVLGLGAAAIRGAYSAMRSSLIRQENFGVDSDGTPEAAPFKVVQNTYAVRLVQPPLDGQRAVFFVETRQTASSEYDQQPDDPRIMETFNLELDAYGNLLRSVDVYYPRRAKTGRTILPDQARLKSTLTHSTYVNHPGADFYLLGKPVTQTLYELSGIAAASTYFTFAEIAAQSAAAMDNVIAFGIPFTPASTQARVTTVSRTYYWSEADPSQPLPLGTITARALVFYELLAASTTELLMSALLLDEAAARALAAGGNYLELDGYWWSPGPAFDYDPARWFVVRSTTDAAGGVTAYTFDPYGLLLVRTVDPLGLATSATNDYYAMQPAAIVDANQNVTASAYDPLLLPVVNTRYGIKGGAIAGNMVLEDYVWQTPPTMAEALADPLRYLQGASSVLLYDMSAFERDGTPVWKMLIARERWFHGADGGLETPVRIILSYSNGATPVVEEKANVAASVTPDPPPGSGATIWITRNRIQLDTQGNQLLRYVPYYTAGAEYDLTPAIPHLTNFYDAMNRVIRIELPDGNVRRTEFTAWSRTEYDENDTNDGSGAFGTPSTIHLDNQGRPIQGSKLNLFEQDGVIVRQELHDYVWLDIVGNVLATTDARFYNAADPDRPLHYVTRTIFDMLDQALNAWSCDAGSRLLFTDASSQPTVQWDGRGFTIVSEYDALGRLTKVHVSGNGLDQDMELLDYGNDPEKNTVGQLVEHRDQLGIEGFPEYDLLDNAVTRTRRFAVDPAGPLNWNDPPVVPLDLETWTILRAFNSLNDLTSETNADGSIGATHYYENGWTREVTYTAPATSTPVTISSMQYAPAGIATNVAYGNGAQAEYEVDPATFRLNRYVARPSAGASPLVDRAYGYDPAGNVLRIEDFTQPPQFFRGQLVEAVSEYTYDTIYQLRSATGRQQPAASSTQCGSVVLPGTPRGAGDPSVLQPYTELYDYDLSGNRLTLQHESGTPDQWYTQEMVVSASSNHSVPKDEPGSSDPDAFFDGDGNLIRLANLRTMAYDYRDELASATIVDRGTGQANDVELYQYDGARVRGRKTLIRLTNGGSTTVTEETLYVGNTVIARTYQTAGTTRTLTRHVNFVSVMAGSERVAIVQTVVAPQAEPSLFRYQLNALSPSVVLELDAAAAVITYEEYFPFGGTAISGGPVPSEVERKRYRYTGKELDRATGLYYYGDRYFVPCMGRWLTPDPEGIRDGLNLYQYCANNPMSYFDDTGSVKVTVFAWNINKTNKNAAVKADALAGIMNMQNIDLVVLQEVSSNTAAFEAALKGHLDEQWGFIFTGSKPPAGQMGTHKFYAEGSQDYYAVIYKKSTVASVTEVGFPDYENDTDLQNEYNSMHFSKRQDFVNNFGRRRPNEYDVTMKSGDTFTLFNWHAPEGGQKMDALPAITVFGQSEHLETVVTSDEVLAIADWNAKAPSVTAALSPSFTPTSTVSSGNWDHSLSSRPLKKRKFTADDRDDIKRVKSDHPPQFFDMNL